MPVKDRDEAAAIDRADPLASFRDRFVVPDGDVLYLAGNSLGPLPRATAARVRRTMEDEWGGNLVEGWDHWVELPTAVGDRLGTQLLGARPGEVLVTDSTTVNLYKLAAAALDARPNRTAVVVDDADFPTDRYVLEGLTSSRALERRPLRELDGDVALVVLSHVHFRTSAIEDMHSV